MLEEPKEFVYETKLLRSGYWWPIRSEFSIVQRSHNNKDNDLWKFKCEGLLPGLLEL